MPTRTTTAKTANCLRLAAVLWALAAAPAALAGGSDLRPVPRERLLPLAAVEQRSMPPVDVPALLEEDVRANSPRREAPLRVGYPMATDLSPANAGTWEQLSGGDRLWRLVVHSARAKWLVLGFGTFRLEAGARLEVYDPGRRTVLGPFTSSDVRDHGELWLPPVDGDTLVAELYWPAALAGVEPRLHLGTVSHGYKDAWGGTADDVERLPGSPEAEVLVSGSCNIDVNCPLGDAWQDQKRGVVHLLSGGSSFCSGSLISNTARDCTPYVLTARHCLSSQGAATSTSFRFNFERPNCGSGSAPTSQVLTGSTLVASYSASDFTLLLLNTAPPIEFAPYYNGWSRATTPGTQSWGIHHPSGDPKKICHNDDPLVDGQSSGWGNDHWRITEWEQGTTEGGSSGSPLFDQNQRIVGQLHGGVASCTTISWDEYGKVAISWNGGGASTSRLSNWLDPLGTGEVAIDGTDLTSCLVPAPDLVLAGQQVQETLGNSDGRADPGEALTLAMSLENLGNSDATSVTGTLSTTTPWVVIGNPVATWPDIPEATVQTSFAPSFGLDLDPAFVCGQPIDLALEVTTAERSEPYVFDLQLGTGTPGAPVVAFSDDMEAGAGGWTSVPLVTTLTWVQDTTQTHTPTHSWFIKDMKVTTDSTLVMPTLANLPPGATLRFYHLHDTESSHDGGVLEYSTNGGGSWQDAGPLMTANGYNSSLGAGESSPLAGRAVWSGDSGGWKLTSVDLSSLGGTNLTLRWRFASNAAISDVGWFVDDVVVDSPTFQCEPRMAAPGEASAPPSGVPFTIALDPGGFALAWSAPIAGGAPTAYKLYRTPLGPAPSAVPACEADLGVSTSRVLPALSDNSGFMVVPVNSLGEGSYGVDRNGVERPHATGGAVCP